MIPALFVHVPATPVASSVMHQNSQCLCSSSSSLFPEWRTAIQRRRSYACFCRSSEVAPRAHCGMAGPAAPVFAARTTIECGKGIGRIITVKWRLWVCVPTPLGISPVSVHHSGPLDSGAKVTCEWDQLVNLTVAFVVFLFLALVSTLCCSSSAVKQTLRSRHQSAAVSWDELVLRLDAVYACCHHQGPLERTSYPRHHQSWFRIALSHR